MLSYYDFEPEIARKIKKTVCHLSGGSESGVTEKQDCNDESEIYAAEETAIWAIWKKSLQTYKIF
jgi:hypothetical protein